MKNLPFVIKSAEAWIVRVPMKEDLVVSEEFGDQVGPWLLETSFLRAPFKIENGFVEVPKGPGIGVEVDVDELENRAEKHFVVRRKS